MITFQESKFYAYYARMNAKLHLPHYFSLMLFFSFSILKKKQRENNDIHGETFMMNAGCKGPKLLQSFSVPVFYPCHLMLKRLMH